ncbi:hypothetical protein [Prevotella amnii]|uniref:Uncharacterized protein n=1 Tax=Prevotella amnii DNF00058 TaxID=1401066 RepID=A0A096D5Y7_9BACT|nr:hypothetical protein [Prevotella amnii]KGF52974.1 hypothetical protein HMPREF9302_02215 [Prevotella amnii DNF00058]
MKKILSLAFLLMLSLSIFAQRQVTKFLGIPVDGSRIAMIQKLKAKGFRYNSYVNGLEGKFNGRNVWIFVQANNNKVWRIFVAYEDSYDKEQIKIQYNSLINQFSNNPRYMVADAKELTDKDDIYQEVSINKKQYAASFYQLPDDENIENRNVWFTIKEDPNDFQKYIIIIFYENKYNEANGEDL